MKAVAAALTATTMHATDAVHDDIELSEAALLERLATQGTRANVLVSTHAASLERVAAHLMTRFPAPIATIVVPGPIRMPEPAGTWLLWDVAQLSPAQQQWLLDWIRTGGATHGIVSISSQPLWPLVASGRFDDHLYYLLNTIVCEATIRSPYDEGAATCRP